jgi:aspartate/methionine/tyrosine aminotransferase
MNPSSQTPPVVPFRRQVVELEDSQIAAVWKLGFEVPGVIGLWVGEGDLPTPGFICEAAARSLAAGNTFYTHKRGIPALRESLARYAGRLYGAQVPVERITVTGSGMNGILLVMETLVDPGDNVVAVTPVWPNALAAVRIMSGEVRSVPLSPRVGRWHLDLDRLFAACDGRTKAIYIASPGNPTGWMMSADEMAEVVRFCRRRGIVYLSDEVYQRFVYDREVAPSALQVMEPEDPVVVANSFSKAWAMTGWRIGWLIHPTAMAGVLDKLIEYNTSGSQHFLQDGCVVAIEQGERFVREQVERCGRARELVVQRLGAMRRVELTRPEAAFYAFFRIEGVEDSLATAMRLVHETQVGLAPGTAFGEGGAGWFRLCFAGSLERIALAMDRLEPILG